MCGRNVHKCGSKRKIGENPGLCDHMLCDMCVKGFGLCVFMRLTPASPGISHVYIYWERRPPPQAVRVCN